MGEEGGVGKEAKRVFVGGEEHTELSMTCWSRALS